MRVKPSANRALHLLTASLLWSIVGSMLMLRGWRWLGPGADRWLALLALTLGTAKSFLLLDKTVTRNISRILDFHDSTCLGAVYSWKTWLLVCAMMLLGRGLRVVMNPGIIIGMIYLAIGWGLLFSSRLSWAAWLRHSHIPGKIAP